MQLKGQLSKIDIDCEIELMRTLSHPNIVQFYESLESPEAVYLVMELVKGSDLYDVIQTFGNLPPNIAGAILGQILTAVQYLHSRGIAHHDIKPENVIVDYLASKVKLTDFGSAKEVKKPAGCTGGTLNFMSPEVLKNMRGALTHQVDGSVDIWGIGVVAYIMLCGFNPFEYKPKANHNIMNRIIDGSYSFPSPYWDNIPKYCKDFIKKCLVVDPKGRATAEELLKHKWITSTSILGDGTLFSKQAQEKLEIEHKSRNNSRQNSVRSLIELFSNCPQRS